MMYLNMYKTKVFVKMQFAFKKIGLIDEIKIIYEPDFSHKCFIRQKHLYSTNMCTRTNCWYKHLGL